MRTDQLQAQLQAGKAVLSVGCNQQIKTNSRDAPPQLHLRIKVPDDLCDYFKEVAGTEAGVPGRWTLNRL